MQAWGMGIMRWKQFTAAAVGAVMLLSMTGCNLADELAAMADDVKESVLGDDSSGNKKERKVQRLPLLLRFIKIQMARP